MPSAQPAPARPKRPKTRWAALARVALFGVLIAARFVDIGEANALGVLPGFAQPAGYRPMLMDETNGEPVRWNACEPIHYVINPVNAPAGGTDEIHKAFDTIAGASGMKFVYDGESAETFDTERDSYQPDRYGERWAPVLVSWTSEPLVHVDELGNQQDAIGLAGPRVEENAQGKPVYVTGSAVLDATDAAAPGMRQPPWNQVLLHELGHVMGLAHVSDPTSVMQPLVAIRPSAFGDADWAGFRAIGLGSPCLSTPELP